MKSKIKSRNANSSNQQAAGRHRRSLATPPPAHPFTRSRCASAQPQTPGCCPLPAAAAERRGVLILVVLSLLVMFALMAMTYVLVASKHYSTAKANARTSANEGSAKDELDTGFMEFLRGSGNPHSPISVWSPFGDLYGDPQSRVVDLDDTGPGTDYATFYGPNSVRGYIAPPTSGGPNPEALAGGQITKMLVKRRCIPAVGPTPPTEVDDFSQVESYYEGCILTMTNGSARGLSTRIVRYYNFNDVGTPTDYRDDSVEIQVVSFQGPNGIIAPQPGDTFLINGRPFSGTGSGYNPATGTLDAKYDPDDNTATDNSLLHALLLHPGFLHTNERDDGNLVTNPYNQNAKNDYVPRAPVPFPGGIPFGGFGGMNEDYDAADYQNPHMSFVTNNGHVILPSFHRPDLINFWRRNYTGTNVDWTDTSNLDSDTLNVDQDAPRLLRRICLRPTPVDHPNFTGSNPLLDRTNPAWQTNLMGLNAAGTDFLQDASGNPISPWDVDNDGDGVADSVWLDLGFPVRTTLDGRKFKTLYAFHVVDLSNRVNVNAHGSTLQADALYSTWNPASSALQNSEFATTALNTAYLPRGMGVGPAEVNLHMVFKSNGEVDNLLRGFTSGTQFFDGRYGSELNNTAVTTDREAGITDDSSTLNQTDQLVRMHQFQYSRSNAYIPSACGSPIDFWGRTAVGLDFLGQPFYWNYDSLRTTPQTNWRLSYYGNTFDTPYDINLSRARASVGGDRTSLTDDHPFTVFDLERILRPWDIDANALSSRLNRMETNTGNSFAWRNLITTDSWDIPTSAAFPPKHLRAANSFPARTLSDVLEPRFKANGMTPVQINYALRTLLAPEFLTGKRMNLNRPFGDGRDSDNTDYASATSTPVAGGTAKVVDEPMLSEIQLEGQNGERAGGTNPLALTNGQDVNSNNVVNGGPAVANDDRLLARQLMARHLYVLARMMMDHGYLPADGMASTNYGKVKWFTEFSGATLSATEQKINKEMAIRRVAQWAVNVVDFMDSDNIMTPFEYDLYPFTQESSVAGATWEVDGLLEPNPIANPTVDDMRPWRGLVWGCEAPVAILTETFAIHDRRVADTNYDTSTNDRGTPTTVQDTDLDQVRIPEGSAFFEIMATHNGFNHSAFPNNAYGSGDLFTKVGDRWYLDLGRLAPAGDDGSGNSNRYPVWRLAISNAHAEEADSIRRAVQQNPDCASLEPRQGLLASHPLFNSYDRLNKFSLHPDQNVLTAAQLDRIEIERIVWFGGIQPTTDQRDGNKLEIYYARQYYNPIPEVANTPLLAAGGYAVIGPRAKTHIGSKSVVGATQRWGVASDQVIDLDFNNNSNVMVRDAADMVDYPTVDTQIRKPMTIIAAADAPTNWGMTNEIIGVSVSEPLPNDNYYIKPTHNNASTGKMDAYDDLETPANTFPDVPFERKNVSTTPLGEYNVGTAAGTQTGTKLNYRTVFLQRLANPLDSYHPIRNPYLTVDWMPIDLTVFNGEDTVTSNWNDNDTNRQAWDPEDSNPNRPGAQETIDDLVRFASRQRGQYSKHSAAMNATEQNLWSIWPDQTVTDPLNDDFNLGGERPKITQPSASNVHFKYVFHNQISAALTPNRGTLGYLNFGYGLPMVASDPRLQNIGFPAQYVGSPTSQPFPWLTWNNRPFANLAELMLVPASHPGRLTLEFSLADTSKNAYKDSNTSASDIPDHRAPFKHLLNMMGSSKTNGNTANFSNLLEYLCIPSPFVGTETILNAQNFSWAGGTPGDDVALGTAGLHPPFNTLSNMRKPGKVNINSIAGYSDAGGYKSDVWNAIVGGDPSSAGGTLFGPSFDLIAKSRQGRNDAGYRFDAAFPSMFANPFRSAASADLAPITALQRNPVNATLWRANGYVSNIDTDTPATSTPLFYGSPSATPPQHNNPNRSAYFAYQNLGRVGTNLTTRSNVFAVWVTVGYFEVEPHQNPNVAAGPNEVYPDGYMLGQELGADTGEIKRHRGFYIFDRSIPVGYERGQDHNVMDAVLLRRLIE